jgi:hypothetical protein
VGDESIPQSAQLQQILQFARNEGNSVKEISTGWPNVDYVVYMDQSLTIQLKEKIDKHISGIEYLKTLGSPHDPPEEIYSCSDTSACVSFPIKKKKLFMTY